MRMLIVEDDLTLVALLKQLLKKDFVIDTAYSGNQANGLIEVTDYDIVILDQNLPDALGSELCTAWRAIGITFPILFLTGATKASCLSTCFSSGGDDFLKKPFHSTELVCRLRALLKRPPTFQNTTYHLDQCVFHAESKRLCSSNTTMQLNCKEGQLLELLLRHQNTIVTRSMIIDHVWENTDDLATNTIEVHVSRLRKKLAQKFQLRCIKTIKNVGYVLSSATAAVATNRKGGDMHV